MVRFLQIALTWLLALALPAQGYAASAMVSCGQAHHHAEFAAPMHDHAAAGVHQHTALTDKSDAHDADEQGIAPDDGAAQIQAAANAVGAKCSACAACCSAAAITTSVPDFDIVPAAADFGPTAFSNGTGITTGGLERPPRIAFA